MTIAATGVFEVTLTPAPADEAAGDTTLGRMTIAKRFHGDLEATSTGQMLTASGAVADSAGYVAIERVSGALHERNGSFVLQHSGLLARGASQLTITVVPDSGTDQLTGLDGTMTITVVDGHHLYDFAYTLPDVE